MSPNHASINPINPNPQPNHAVADTQNSQKIGITAAILSQLLFGVLYVYSKWLAPLTGTQVFLWRMVMMWICLVLLVVAMGKHRAIKAELHALFVQPKTFLGTQSRKWTWLWLLIPTPIFASQLWLFMWAPVNGQGVQVAMGFFFFPLVMVAIGALLGEKLSRIEWIAVALAGAGAMTEVVRTGQVNLATAWVCLGYPIYYVMRRIQGIRPLTSLILDISLIAPVCLVWIICKEDLSVLNDLMVVMKIIGLGVVSVLALQLNLLANQKLSTSLFGLLSYLEPALLFLLSITVLGQVVAPAMFISFGLIWLGLICLMTNQLRTLKNLRKKPT